MQNIPIKSIPEELVKLFNLRYLNLSHTQVEELPNSIGELINLQTLDISNSKVDALPSGIVKCKNLRYLKVHRYANYSSSAYTNLKGTEMPEDIWKLKNMQVLASIEARDGIVKKLGCMTQLRRIGITKVRGADKIYLCNTVEKLKLLRSLFIMASNEEESLRLDVLSCAPPLLQSLAIVGKLEKVPHWFGSLRNLTSLYLRWSRLSADPLPHLNELSSLVFLHLNNAFDGKLLCIRKGWFLKLKDLVFSHFSCLNDVIIEKEGLPNLEKLLLTECKELKMVPLGIEYLSNMQVLTMQNMSDELVMRLRGENSIDHPRVRHIPEIENFYLTPQFKWAYESLSSASSDHKS